jgi:hypothetical protein
LTAPAPAPAPGRDLRLDLFRGVGLVFIFLDHVPDNWISYLTLANVVFCDAAEIFIFISGYAAALAFGRIAEREGFVFAGVQALRRTWTLYVAHVFLFVIFVAQVAWATRRLANPMFAEELNVASFLDEPAVAVLKALSLQLQPMFMNILPLYIVLLIALALLLPLLRRFLAPVLAVSFALWAATQATGFNLPGHPDGTWFFNPFAWQALFLLGAACGYSGHVAGRVPAALRPPKLPVAAAALALCVAGKLALTFGTRFELIPGWLFDATWRLADKTAMGPLRLLSFVALAGVTVALVRPDSAWLADRRLRPLIRCGQHSLAIFCLGIFLSVAGHAILTEWGHGWIPEAAVSVAGIAAMLLAARFLAWAKRRPVAARAPAAGGGEP